MFKISSSTVRLMFLLGWRIYGEPGGGCPWAQSRLLGAGGGRERRTGEESRHGAIRDRRGIHWGEMCMNTCPWFQHDLCISNVTDNQRKEHFLNSYDHRWRHYSRLRKSKLCNVAKRIWTDNAFPSSANTRCQSGTTRITPPSGGADTAQGSACKSGISTGSTGSKSTRRWDRRNCECALIHVPVRLQTYFQDHDYNLFWLFNIEK